MKKWKYEFLCEQSLSDIKSSLDYFGDIGWECFNIEHIVSSNGNEQYTAFLKKQIVDTDEKTE